MNTPPAEAAACAQWAAALWAPVPGGDEALPCPPGLQCWNGSSPARRFAVHRNTVWNTCVEALVNTFPAAQHLLGPDRFAAMARGWLQQRPPRSAVLSELGAGLADWLDTMTLPPDCPWLPDLLRLEWLRHQAFNAADEPALGPAQLSCRLGRPESLQHARLGLHPSLALMSSPHAVLDRWQAALSAQTGAASWQPALAGSKANPHENPQEPQEPLEEHLLVLRHNAATGLYLPDSVLALSVSPATWRGVQALQGGQTLGAAWVQALAAHKAATETEDSSDLQPSLAETLGLLIRHGAVTAWHTTVPETP